MAKTSITGAITISQGDVFSDSSVQEHVLGTVGYADNGRAFRYVKAGGTALVPGKLQQGPAVVANHQNIAASAAAAAGATTVTFTLGATAATANQYAGGTLVINDVDGEGYTYRIASHAAADSSGVITLKLDDPILVALTTNSEACLFPNTYNGVIVNPTTPTNAPVGVAVKAITANQYGWIQTHGPVSCLNDSATAVGLGVAPSQAVAGAVKTMAATLSQVGYALQAGVDTEYRTVFLTID
jgi:hypothetical protein